VANQTIFTPRQAVTFTFIAFGALVGSNIGAIPVLRDQSGISVFAFGMLAALGTLVNVGMMGLGGPINRRYGHRTVLLFILPCSFAGLIFSQSVHSVLSFALAMIVINLALGVLDLFMNAEGSSVEHDAGRPILSAFHGAVLYALGLFSLIGSYVSVNYGAIWTILPPLPLVVLAFWAVADAIPKRDQEAEAQKPKPAALPRQALILIGAVIGLDVACEITCVQWSGQMLALLRPELAAYSGLGAAFYGLCSGTLRFTGDRLRQKFGDVPIVVTSFLVAMPGLVTLSLAPGFLASVIAFAIVGAGLALVFPSLFSLAASLAPESRAAALGLVAAVSGPPRILLPIILGSIAMAYGLSAIYIAAALSIVLALSFMLWVGIEVTKLKKTREVLAPSVLK
jgi:MFS family permease